MRRTPPWSLFLVAALFACVACGGDDGGAPVDASGSSGSGTTASATTATAPGDSGSSADSGSSGGVDTTGASSTGSSETTGAALCPDVGEPCTICESTQCPDEYCGCYDNGSCLLLAQCAAQCDAGDAACNQACWTQYPAGISDGALLTHCAATTCTDACGPFVPLTPCQQCLYAECPVQMNGCVSNPECTALLECLAACTEAGCETTCYTAHPDGLADSGPVGDCSQVACLQACA